MKNLACLLLICLLLSLPGLRSPAGFYHDDAIYMLTGRALAEGRGYRIISLPGAPPQTKYPPLYPLLLSLLWRLSPHFPACVTLFRLANIAAWLAALALTYDLLVRFRYASPRAALVVVALRGIAPDSARMTGLVITETLTTLLVTGCLWCAEYALQADEPAVRVRRAACAGLLLGLAVLTHSSVGLLWLALAAAFYSQRASLLVPMTLVALPAFLGWSLWSRQAGHLPGWDLRSYYLDYLGWVGHQYRLIPLPTVVAANLEQLVLFGLPAHVIPFDTNSGLAALLPRGFAWFLALFGLTVTALILLGGATLLRKRRPLIPLAVLTLTLPGCIWPAGGGRYTFPASLLCVTLALIGWNALMARSGRWKIAMGVGTAAAIGLSLACTASVLIANLHTPAPRPTESLESWVRTHVPIDEAVCARDDARLFLTTGRKGISDRAWMDLTWDRLTVDWHGRAGYCPEAGRQATLLKSLGIRWLIDAGPPGRPHGWGTPNLLQAHPEWFQLIYDAGPANFRVYGWR